ncbi:hypothetical protein EJ08DRAFT_583287 [Tothia fuscella]|uniref:Prokaryotic-type class I peptide chain release factors domain-containing protein n=1 Tax=Tothia fuscella TaxID=1048955 RepID=A0A9P4NWQ0_9PEZI|nr:hypothetical protein EJ08DRAFT_583287 [Tothia fuscella]
MLQRATIFASIIHNGARIARTGNFVVQRYKTTSAEPTTAEDIAACRQWLSKFNLETIPKRLCELSFSRSSGPGGQNVNKVSTKATLRLPLIHLTPLIPPLLHSPIRQSRHYAPKSDALVIQADDSRKQSDNANLCFIKLYDLITEVGGKVLPGETSQVQREHVIKLQKRENEHRLRGKKTHSLKKAGRRIGGE